MNLDDPCYNCGSKRADWMDYGDGEWRLNCVKCGNLLELRED